MQYIKGSAFLSWLFATMMMCSYDALAQTEQGDSPPSSPASSSSQTSGLSGKERWWQRFELGGKLGLSLATFVGESAMSDSADYTHKTSLALAGTINIGLLRWLSLQPEILFVSKGSDVEVDGRVTDTFDGSYIDFPLLVRVMLPLGEQVTPYMLAGPTLGVLLSFKLKDHEDGSIADRTDRAKPLDLGLLGGVGVEFALSHQHALLLEARYNRSLGTIPEDEAEDLKNSVFTFMLGYQYSLSSGAR